MSRFHSTINRRDFMKGLGVIGAGIGSASVVAPPFQDLDELTSSSKGSIYPWWVKYREFEDLTTPIDWSIFEPFDSKKFVMPVIHDDAKSAVAERDKRETQEGLAGKLPGRSLRDIAVSESSNRVYPTTPPWDGPTDRVATPESRGTVPWQGTPEENLQTLRAAMSYFGCNKVGVIEVNEHTKRLFNKDAINWADVDKPTYVNNIYTVPNKCKWIVTWAVQQHYVFSVYGLSEDLASPSGYGTRRPLGSTSGRAYGDAPIIRYMNNRFIKNLGYMTLKPTASGNVPFGIFSGLGEQGRPAYLNTPDVGLMIRYTDYAITDWPLAPTPPIDAGIHSFCKACKRCGEACPSQSISMSDDGAWETRSPGNRPGYRGFFMDWQTCIDYGSPGACANCHTVCPFNHPAEGIIHPVVRAVAANTTVFNNFFGQMDRTFGYGKVKSEEECQAWWDRDIRTWRHDTILGTGRIVW